MTITQATVLAVRGSSLIALAFLAGCAASKPAQSEPASASNPPEQSSSGSEQATDKPSASAASKKTAPAVDGAEGPALSVRLIEPGAEPRKALRYQIAVGDVSESDMKMGMRMAMSIGGQTLPAATLPVTKSRLRWGPSENATPGENGGDIRYPFELVDMQVTPTPGVPDDMAKAVQSELDGLKGTKGWSIVSPRGMTIDSNITVAPATSERTAQTIKQIHDGLRQMPAVFPEQPVGVGARWSVTMLVDGPIKMTQVATYTLVEHQGTTGSLRFEIKQTAKPQAMTAGVPNAGPGVNARLTALDGGGEGTLKFDLKRLVPESKMETSTKMSVTVQAQGQTTQMVTELGIELETSPGRS